MLALAKKRGILFTLSGVIDDGFDPWKMDHVKRWRNFDGWFLSTHIFPLFIITIILLGSLEGVWWAWAFGYSMAGQSWSTNNGQKLPKFNFSLYWSTSFNFGVVQIIIFWFYISSPGINWLNIIWYEMNEMLRHINLRKTYIPILSNFL